MSGAERSRLAKKSSKQNVCLSLNDLQDHRYSINPKRSPTEPHWPIQFLRQHLSNWNSTLTWHVSWHSRSSVCLSDASLPAPYPRRKKRNYSTATCTVLEEYWESVSPSNHPPALQAWSHKKKLFTRVWSIKKNKISCRNVQIYASRKHGIRSLWTLSFCQIVYK